MTKYKIYAAIDENNSSATHIGIFKYDPNGNPYRIDKYKDSRVTDEKFLEMVNKIWKEIINV